MQIYDIDSSHAFVKKLHIKPYKSGRLDGLSFAVKDLIDIEGEITGSGNPTWAKTHPKAAIHAVCVEQLLLEGATCLEKTVTDELAYSLIGENHFYGTPVNPKAPDRVPGGSSSGSASAVSAGLVDFALGTDTGGSVRVPASNCGIWGYRPSHGRISVAGVFPFAPTFDTVGVLARSGEILHKVVSVLMGSEKDEQFTNPQIIILDDIFKVCDLEVQEALLSAINKIDKKFTFRRSNLIDIINFPTDVPWLYDTFTLLQCAEIWSCLGSWIEDVHPEFGPVTRSNFNNLAKGAERTKIQEYILRREQFALQLNEFLGMSHLICFPTTPTLAPKLGTIGRDVQGRSSGNYYPRSLGIDAISGLARAPQITIPLTEINGIPIGLSIMGGYGKDVLLSRVLQHLS